MHRHFFVDISGNHPNLLIKKKAQNVALAEPSQNKRFFYTCSTAIEADNRIGPSTNIVEENVDSDSEARPRGGFSWTIQSFSDGKERGKERWKIRRLKLECVASCRYWPRFVRLSIVLATVAEHIAPERQKACQRSLLLPLHFFFRRLFLFLAACPNGSRTNKSL